MDESPFLIIGAGISGLAFADSIGGKGFLICESDAEMGGYCKTIRQDGFTWDYSGHFFHFRHPEIEAELVGRMPGPVLRVQRDSRIWYGDRTIDFPFQRNIHQLPEAEYRECLQGLRERDTREPRDFKDMLLLKYGRGISEKFLIPYNEKLYATDLSTLDIDAMGRFFPHANLEEIIANASRPDNGGGYNATFTYPEGGAIQYVEALASGIDPAQIRLGERVLNIDVKRRIAHTTNGQVRYRSVVSSAPFDQLLRLCDIEHDPDRFSANRVLVFNLGFDKKGPKDVHWMYVPQERIPFYRVGFYDNIFGAERMSLYVEIGLPPGPVLEKADIDHWRQRALAGLRDIGVLEDQSLVSEHCVVLDPAYVHITQQSIEDVQKHKAALAEHGVYSIGRYGSWTYCSIEDNIVEARNLARALGAGRTAASTRPI